MWADTADVQEVCTVGVGSRRRVLGVLGQLTAESEGGWRYVLYYGLGRVFFTLTEVG